jgi:hypothetical protein
MERALDPRLFYHIAFLFHQEVHFAVADLRMINPKSFGSFE